MYILFRDSMFNEESTKKSLQLQMQYEFDKKETITKASQDKKDAVSKTEIKTQKIIRNFSYAGTLAVFGFAGYGFYRFRRRKRLQAQQEMLNERLRISRELHDDIGSTLGSISIYSEVAKSRNEKNESAEEALSKIGITSRELIDKMSDIVWSLNPNNESFEQLQNRMTAFLAMMLTPRNIVYRFEADEEAKKIQLTGEQRKNIFLIFKEAIYNIAKYAESKKVNIHLNMENNIFKMLIQDDGKGFDPLSFGEGRGEVYNGNGIKNMQARAEEMGARLHIISGTNAGTSVELTAPI
jgi:signal transduction histidine kinase